MNKQLDQLKYSEKELEAIRLSIDSTYLDSKDDSEIKETEKEIQVEVQDGSW